ncbi:alpha/beta hydrolase [Streptomyces flavofungini]|uniref:alpha/beta hydrolase n=1 Tax=Streptomyces flavofungini TaxID=68200 RepID=UPI0025B1D680|nr:alpha/beta hydrolase [Streptomyces flavofungini]WJV48827.1 alpha/beta hydrolase [Streptomyces flavofungini]
MQHSAYRRRLVPVLALGVVAGLAPGLVGGSASAAPGDGAAASSPVARADADADRLAPFTRQKLTWKRCAADQPAKYQCATLKVPLDYDKPEGKRIDVAISRVKTSVPGKRRGVLTFNPGGPGGAGLDLSLVFAGGLPKNVREQYDMVGFDPRGVGESTPVECGLTEAEQVFPRPTRSAAEHAANTKWAKRVADKCRAKYGSSLAHMSTRNTARDMDVMRAALGEKKLSYFGVSYGTALGAVYMQLFPQRADRFVLDSAVDPGRMWRGMFQVWAPEAERAFKRWTKWTAARDATYHLGDSPAKVARTFRKLVARADVDPIVVDGQKLDGAAVRDITRAEFFTVRSGAKTVADLKKAAEGRQVRELPGAQEQSPDNVTSSQLAVVCSDASWPRDPETYRRDAIRDTVRYPLYGDFASSITPCASWGKGAEPATKVDNAVKSLVVQNEWDSQTPLVTGQAMHRALKGSRMVTVSGGEGHGVVFGDTRNSCAEKATMGYLRTGRLPAKDLTCKAASGGQRRAETARPAPTPFGLR